MAVVCGAKSFRGEPGGTEVEPCRGASKHQLGSQAPVPRQTLGPEQLGSAICGAFYSAPPPRRPGPRGRGR